METNFRKVFLARIDPIKLIRLLFNRVRPVNIRPRAERRIETFNRVNIIIQ